MVRRSSILAIAALWGGGNLYAQAVISAKAGLVSYSLGNVTVDGRRVRPSTTRFTLLKQNSLLRAGRGLAEVLLGPCSAVRVAHDSSFRLTDASVTHPRLELLSGSAVVEISEIARESDVTLDVKSETVRMSRAGLYRIDFLPALLKVFAGRAAVRVDGRSLDVASGRTFSLPGGQLGRFDRRPLDELDRWSGRRAVELAETRVSWQESWPDLLNTDNSAEFARYSAGPRGESSAPVLTGMKKTSVLPGCVAGR